MPPKVPPPPGIAGKAPTSSEAQTLIGLLTSAQQIELQSAFRQFDVDGNGTMCVPPTVSPAAQAAPSANTSAHTRIKPLDDPPTPHNLFSLTRACASLVRSDSTELKAVMTQLGSPMSDQQVKAIIDTLDMDSNGKIEWAEFASLMADRWLRHEGATDMHLALGLLRPEDGLDEDDDDAEIAVERIGKLLMGAGEKPLIAAEWAEMKQLMDPKGTGRVSVKAFRDLPCWAPPDLPGQELLRAHQKRREQGLQAGDTVVTSP